MEKEIKVSIIMPVYNVEDYVGRAIESILNQTLKEFEFIIVDDGATDGSGKICDQYAEKDSRIRVIHKENGGAPSARNAAIEIASGKYMYFMDSDDWAEQGMLEDMYALAEEHQAQLVVAGFYIDTYFNKEEYLTDDYVSEDAVYTNKETFRKKAYKLFDKNLLYTPWNKLYLASYLMEHEIRFPKTFWDDFPFNLHVIENVERVVVTSNQYYHFLRARAESETAAYRPDMYKKREEEHGWLINLYKKWGIMNGGTREFLARRYVERLIGCIENVTNPKCELPYTEKYHMIKQMLGKKRVSWAMKHAKPKSKYMSCMLVPVKMKNVTLCLIEGMVISYVKTHHTKLFSKLKFRR